MSLDGMSQLLRGPGLLEQPRRLDGVKIGVEHLPIKVVKQPHLSPKVHVLGIVLGRKVTHETAYGLAVLHMEGILVVLAQKVMGLLVGKPAFEFRHCAPPSHSLSQPKAPSRSCLEPINPV